MDHRFGPQDRCGNGPVSVSVVAKVLEILSRFRSTQGFFFVSMLLWLTFISENGAKGSCQVSQDENINKSYCFRK